MIKIINTGEQTTSKRQTRYIIMIKGEVIASFWHNPKEGLSKCLKTASNTVSSITHSPEHNSD